MSDSIDPQASLPDPTEADALMPAAMPPPDDAGEAPLGPITDSEVAAGEPIPVPNDGLGEWPTHGGPLGCLVSVTVGFLLAGFIARFVVSLAQYHKHGANFGGWFLAVTAAVAIFAVFLFASGWIGWRLGKRIFRVYEPSPRQVRIAERVQRGQ